MHSNKVCKQAPNQKICKYSLKVGTRLQHDRMQQNYGMRGASDMFGCPGELIITRKQIVNKALVAQKVQQTAGRGHGKGSSPEIQVNIGRTRNQL